MNDTEAVARERVIAERRRRGWSQRRAAVAGGVSNTLWNDFEGGRVPTDGSRAPTMRHAVADAFGWDLDWPENPPAALVQPSSAAVRQVAEDAVSLVMATMTDGKADILEAVAVLAELHERHAVQLHLLNTKVDAILRAMKIDPGAIHQAKTEDGGTDNPQNKQRAKRPSKNAH